jgi:GntR family transcriptional regulator/MocR family aminotransferase
MAKKRSTLPFTLITIDRKSKESLQEQLTNQLRQMILRGVYQPGARLPSTRALGSELGLSRNTVLCAFDQLTAEGYLEGRTGAGSFIAHTLPENMLRAETPAHSGIPISSAKCSRYAERAIKAPRVFGDLAIPNQPFRPSLPAYDTFPMQLWAKLQSQTWRTASSTLLGYGDAAGYLPLRKTLATYLKEYRGVQCSEEQIILTAGSQHALHLTAKVLLEPGDSAIIEDPGYSSAQGAFLTNEATLIAQPLDSEGMVIPKQKSKVKVIYMTPSYQYPMGVVMSLARRLEWLQFAEQHAAWIIEDDYDSEFRYSGRPIPALQGLNNGAHVIYMGTFSKMILPALRIGYLVVPPQLRQAFVAARAANGLHCQTVDQAVLNRFIEEGHFHRHLREMRTLYAARQKLFLKILRAELSEFLYATEAPAGMHLPVFLTDKVKSSAQVIATAAEKKGMTLLPLSRLTIKTKVNEGFLMGYTSFTGKRMREGIAVLGEILARS